MDFKRNGLQHLNAFLEYIAILGIQEPTKSDLVCPSVDCILVEAIVVNVVCGVIN